jgi:predicted Zn-dependent protease
MLYIALFLASLAMAQDTLAPVDRLIAAGQYHNALEALQQNPTRAFRWHLLASKAYEGLNDPAHAVSEAEAALALDARSEAAHLQLGQIFLSHNTPGAAYEIFSEAQQMFPDSFLVRLGKGLALKEIGKFDEAAVELRRCVAQQPSSGVAFDALATVLLHDSKFEEVRKVSETFTNRNPEDFRGYYYAAAGREGLGLPEDATYKLIEKSLSLNSNFAASLSLLGKIQLRRGAAQDAAVALQRAVALRPDHVPSHMMLANAYRKMGRETEAAREFQTIRELHDRERQPQPSLLYHRGK